MKPLTLKESAILQKMVDEIKKYYKKAYINALTSELGMSGILLLALWNSNGRYKYPTIYKNKKLLKKYFHLLVNSHLN